MSSDLAPLARVTLHDLARAAGVSPATVDRVVNNRQGVHPRTREAVMATARRLGYVTDAAATPEPARAPARLVFLLPAGTNRFMDVLRDQIEAQAALRADVKARVEMIEGFNPEKLGAHLQALPPEVEGIGLIALDHPLVREAIRDLARRGMHVVTLASDIQVPRVAYVGIDNVQAGRLAGYVMGRLLAGRADPEVALLAGSLAYRGHGEREVGFRTVLAEEFGHVRVVELREMLDDRDRAEAEARALLDRHPGLAGIYNVGGGNAGIARALASKGLARAVVLIGHEATEGNKRLLLDGTLDAVIDQNPRVEAREALNALAAAARGEGYAVIAPRLAIVFRENLPDD
jgi:LacI family transcriptional regulator